MKINKKVLMVSAIILIVGLPTIAFANDGTALLDNLFKFIATWIGRIGGLVAFLGAIQFAFGWVQHNPDARLQGLTMIMAGFMTVGITKVPQLFGM
jgi:hypothetical protein